MDVSVAQRTAIGQNLPYIKWLLSHGKQLDALLSGIETIASAKSISEGWLALKSEGDLVISILADFPGLSSVLHVSSESNTVSLHNQYQHATDEEIDAVIAHPEVKANGAIIGKLIDSLPQILAFIQGLMKFFPAAAGA